MHNKNSQLMLGKKKKDVNENRGAAVTERVKVVTK